MAAAISVKSGAENANLQTLFSKVQHVYYDTTAINGFTTAIECEMEFPTLEDGVTFNTGDVDKTEIKLTDGTIWTSKATKGDSDIQFQVASLNDTINSVFLSKKDNSVSGVTLFGGSAQYSGKGYALDVKKATGALVMTDDTGDTAIILPNVEMYGALVASDGDNPAYFNVKVTPKANTAGVAIYVLQKGA